MKQSLFESRHQPQWQAFAEQLNRLERGTAKASDVADFPHQYQRLCQHLALAQERGYSSYLVDPLQQLALRGHQQLYRHRSHLGASMLGFVLAGFPRLVREQWRFVAVASVLFFGSLLGIALLVYLFPELIYSIISPQQVAEMQDMYDPDASRLGRAAERASSEDWMMFGYYVMHNIGIAFQTFAAGLLFGLGSVFFLIFNGLIIGAVSGHLTEIGYGQTFWSFVVGHGAFELTAIALAGAAGLQLGWALISPGRLTRGESLRLAAHKSVQLLCGVMVFLLIAAFIEAYWSSTTVIAAWVKYLVGAVLWLLVAAYLIFAGRTQHAPK
ncbi:putative membrane protein SpoIIM required for sporulation [Pseudomonas rhodesiae]|uniref:stage II sporulation protein M n=1 Tax=Pseudomonas rhodesiae TaxID=76760 RepID=UPI001608C9D8|nr:stage II sporulation protein M [Pseudomonas rhodesiae]MBB4812031.1 putative membrane protein SpoIIM required for sporulation [Pseudomonas rhodesiae]